MKFSDDLRRIGSQQAGCLTTEAGEVWHPANLLISAAETLDGLADLAQWMTGCGYDFTQHEYFRRNVHLLAGSGNADQTQEPAICPDCGMAESFDGMWHKPGCENL